METTTKFTFGDIYEMWLGFGLIDSDPSWESFIAYVSNQIGIEISPTAQAKLRRYIRKTYAPDLYTQ